jgi:hypothetical protein
MVETTNQLIDAVKSNDIPSFDGQMLMFLCGKLAFFWWTLIFHVISVLARSHFS